MSAVRSQKGAAVWWILVLAIILAGAAYYWFFLRSEAPEEAAIQPPTVSPPPVAVTPRPEPERAAEDTLPQRTIEEQPAEAEAPLPDLADSDTAAMATAQLIFGETPAREYFVPEGMISKLVAAIDALTLEEIPKNIVPLQSPEGEFEAESAGETEQINPETGLPERLYVLDPGNFQRYTAQVEVFEAADTKVLVEQYQHYYPLLSQSYQELRPDGDFSQRLVEVIDHLLAAPEPAAPVRLVKPEATYEFADPQLEALSAGQKLLIRMGPSNAARVKAKLSEIREALLQTQRE